MLKTFNPDGERDLVFIPVGVNYDRVLEDRTLLLKSDAARPRRGFSHAVAVALGFAGRQLRNMALGRWYRSATRASTSAGRFRCAIMCGGRVLTFARSPTASGTSELRRLAPR